MKRRSFLMAAAGLFLPYEPERIYSFPTRVRQADFERSYVWAPYVPFLVLPTIPPLPEFLCRYLKEVPFPVPSAMANESSNRKVDTDALVVAPHGPSTSPSR